MRLSLLLWAGAMAIATATLMVGHWVTMPRPEGDDDSLAAAIADLRRPGARWLAVHVMYAECGCSRPVLEHLVTSPRPAGISDKVVLVGPVPDFEAQAARAGIAVEFVDAATLASRFHIEATLVLIVVDPRGTVRYLGGYSDRKRDLAIEDVEMIAGTMRDGSAAPRPLFGCAASESADLGRARPRGVRRPPVGGDLLRRPQLLRQRHRSRADRRGADTGARRAESRHAARPRLAQLKRVLHTLSRGGDACDAT